MQHKQLMEQAALARETRQRFHEPELAHTHRACRAAASHETADEVRFTGHAFGSGTCVLLLLASMCFSMPQKLATHWLLNNMAVKCATQKLAARFKAWPDFAPEPIACVAGHSKQTKRVAKQAEDYQAARRGRRHTCTQNGNTACLHLHRASSLRGGMTSLWSKG